MAKRLVKKGSTDVTLDVFIQDSSSTTGAGLTGLAFNTASLVCYYRRGATGTPTALTLATQTVGGAHSDGGFVAVDGTNMPGQYRLDLSDAIVATGVPYVTVMLKGAANMAPVTIELQLTDVDVEDAADFGLTNLDAAISTRASQTSVDTIDNFIDTEIADIQARLPAALVGGRMASDMEAISGDATAAANLENAFDDTAGPVPWLGILDQGTAQSATATTLVLRAATPFAADDVPIGATVWVLGSTQGYWQAGIITDYTTATDTATVTFPVTPSGTITYKIIGTAPTPSAMPVPANMVQVSGDATAADNAEAFFDGTGYKDVDNLYIIRSATAQAGAAGTITLDASASAVDDFYNNTYVQIISGTGVGQARFISDYVGATKVATVNANWATTPDNTSVFVIYPFGSIPGATAPSASDIWSHATRVLTAATNITSTGAAVPITAGGKVDSDATAISGDATAADNLELAADGTGYNLGAGQVVAASVTGAVGSVTGNVGGNVVGSVASVTGNVGGNVVGSVASVTGAVGSVTGNVGGNVVGSVGTVNALAADSLTASALATDAVTEIVNAVLTTAMTESYNTDGSPATVAQALYAIMQRVTEFSISGTTITVKKLDGSTTAMTLTLDSSTSPTSSTRAT